MFRCPRRSRPLVLSGVQGEALDGSFPRARRSMLNATSTELKGPSREEVPCTEPAHLHLGRLEIRSTTRDRMEEGSVTTCHPMSPSPSPSYFGPEALLGSPPCSTPVRSCLQSSADHYVAPRRLPWLRATPPGKPRHDSVLGAAADGRQADLRGCQGAGEIVPLRTTFRRRWIGLAPPPPLRPRASSQQLMICVADSTRGVGANISIGFVPGFHGCSVSDGRYGKKKTLVLALGRKCQMNQLPHRVGNSRCSAPSRGHLDRAPQGRLQVHYGGRRVSLARICRGGRVPELIYSK